LPNLAKDYQLLLDKTREELDTIIERERAGGVEIEAMLKERDPTEEIVNIVR
jgi:hypothetical protein